MQRIPVGPFDVFGLVVSAAFFGAFCVGAAYVESLPTFGFMAAIVLSLIGIATFGIRVLSRIDR